jgi:proteasome lid subunit RPN8/RPN11
MRLTDAQLKRVYTHAQEVYPRECCGFLIGEPGEGGAVHQVVPGTNLAPEERADRFEMDPLDILRAEERAEAAGLAVIGYYHSHPDWPAIPSQEDLRWAWPGPRYLLVAVHRGRPLDARVWLLEEDETGKRFVPGRLEIAAADASAT